MTRNLTPPGHGRGRNRAHPEVPKLAELAVGVPAPARPVAARDGAGRFLPGDGTVELGRAGGRALAEQRQLAQLLGLWEPPPEHPFAPYARLARDWRDGHLATLAATVGGGEVGPGPASIVSSAAMQLAASRWAYDEGARLGDAKLLGESSRLADASRQNLLASHELAAREAAARKASSVPDWRQLFATVQSPAEPSSPPPPASGATANKSASEGRSDPATKEPTP
jgi:hypothetical protein